MKKIHLATFFHFNKVQIGRIKSALIHETGIFRRSTSSPFSIFKALFPVPKVVADVLVLFTAFVVDELTSEIQRSLRAETRRSIRRSDVKRNRPTRPSHSRLWPCHRVPAFWHKKTFEPNLGLQQPIVEWLVSSLHSSFQIQIFFLLISHLQQQSSQLPSTKPNPTKSRKRRILDKN